jgi:3'-phosphoadenosine 5'-phosphosulfate sulfotransferase (PAPS reductase)/FAD synthetase
MTTYEPLNFEGTDNLNFLPEDNEPSLYEILRNCNDKYISKQINSALDILMNSIRLYGTDHIFMSYNGGKDADVIMHLLRAVYAKYGEENRIYHCIPRLTYFVIEDEFPEVLSHIETTEKKYHLNIVRYDCGVVEVGYFLFFHSCVSDRWFLIGYKEAN